uniref:Cyclin-C isoform X3 n=1 Tax=Phascolarctos cinereus TaxID=38626 RepID=A0A6P5LB55_PHACI|nr:cyclin-C isoform X3 [Phascolarctos cinereus]
MGTPAQWLLASPAPDRRSLASFPRDLPSRLGPRELRHLLRRPRPLLSPSLALAPVSPGRTGTCVCGNGFVRRCVAGRPRGGRVLSASFRSRRRRRRGAERSGAGWPSAGGVYGRSVAWCSSPRGSRSPWQGTSGRVPTIIQALGEHLKLRQQVIATATVYFKRFYARYSLKSIDPVLMAPTCVFLASKVEEFGVVSNTRLISAATSVLKTRFSYAFPKEFPYRMNHILECEFYLLELMM